MFILILVIMIRIDCTLKFVSRHHFIGEPQWVRLDPENHNRESATGMSANFTAWIVGSPLPTPEDWKWSFTPSVYSRTKTSHPGGVYLTVSGHVGRLQINKVTWDHYGVYTITARNEHSVQDHKMSFTLIPSSKIDEIHHFICA